MSGARAVVAVDPVEAGAGALATIDAFWSPRAARRFSAKCVFSTAWRWLAYPGTFVWSSVSQPTEKSWYCVVA